MSRSIKEIKMNNNRSLVIAGVAVLAVILSVAASLIFPGPTSSAQLIPVTGGSISVGSPFYQNGMQDQAAGLSTKVGTPFYQNGMQDQAAVSSAKVGTPFYQNAMQNQETGPSN
jgi:hypothetical protein